MQTLLQISRMREQMAMKWVVKPGFAFWRCVQQGSFSKNSSSGFLFFHFHPHLYMFTFTARGKIIKSSLSLAVTTHLHSIGARTMIHRASTAMRKRRCSWPANIRVRTPLPCPLFALTWGQRPGTHIVHPPCTCQVTDFRSSNCTWIKLACSELSSFR